MLAAVPGCKTMVVKYLETAGLVACCFLISTSNAYKYQLRKGETGRYTYYNATQESDLHCRYCPNNVTFSSDDVNKQYQESSCVSKNYPWDKLDQEEKSKKLYPVCKIGEIPSCVKPQIPVGGFWKCEESENLDKVPVYTTCQLHCDSGYKKVGEGHIYCNESRKFDPPWIETTCIASTEFPLFAVSTSKAYKYRLRKGETGRYTYYNATQESDLHCRYCPNNVTFSSDDVNKQYQESSCVSKNYPWDKLDQEEKSKKLYPVCKIGEIPSCVKPQIPVGGFWKCEESENLDKVPVYTTCQLHCDSGYKKVGEGHIYCNESRKFDPPWTETTCIASREFPLFVVCAAVAVAVLICILLMNVYCCKRYPQQCKNAFSKINRGLKKQKSTLVSNTIRESVIVLDSVQLTTITNDVQMTNPSKEPLLPQKPTAKREEKRPIENDDYSDYLIHKIDIEKAHKLFPDSERSLDTSDYGQHTDSRPRPEGSSDFISGRSEPLKQYRQGSSDPKEMRDSHETYSKEFARDPTFCDRKVNIGLILELKKLSPIKYCEDILKLVADMRGINSGHRSDPSDYERDLRIGHIVYYLSQNQRKDYDNIMHQLQIVHPDCIFCNSLYGDMAI